MVRFIFTPHLLCRNLKHPRITAVILLGQSGKLHIKQKDPAEAGPIEPLQGLDFAVWRKLKTPVIGPACFQTLGATTGVAMLQAM